MKEHRYRITVEHLADANGLSSPCGSSLQFEIGNHDDLFAVVRRVCQRGALDETAATALAIGLKLFSEVMLENRENPLFEEFSPALAGFMKQLKGRQPS